MTAARWVDVAWPPLVIVQSLSPVSAVLAVLALLGAVAYGRRSGRLVLAGTSVAVLAVQAALWVPWLTDEPVHRGQHLTVMTVNLYKGRADIAAITRMVRAEGVDVLTVSELTPAAAANVQRSELDDVLPHAMPSDTGSSPTTALLSRQPLVPLPATAPDSPGAAVRAQVATLPRSAGVTVCAVHPYPPVPGRIRKWRRSQVQLTEWAARTTDPVVVAGDFNASIDHPGLRDVLSTGLRDAHEVAGAGRPVTWPFGRTLPPFVQIDHVLVRGLDVESVKEVRVPGSDHAAVVAHLVVPAAGR